ncbi:hypothetical protein B0H14DRAFT_2656615, partial [Mycena olivaceomarginata]
LLSSDPAFPQLSRCLAKAPLGQDAEPPAPHHLPHVLQQLTPPVWLHNWGKAALGGKEDTQKKGKRRKAQGKGKVKARRRAKAKDSKEEDAWTQVQRRGGAGSGSQHRARPDPHTDEEEEVDELENKRGELPFSAKSSKKYQVVFALGRGGHAWVCEDGFTFKHTPTCSMEVDTLPAEKDMNEVAPALPAEKGMHNTSPALPAEKDTNEVPAHPTCQEGRTKAPPTPPAKKDTHEAAAHPTTGRVGNKAPPAPPANKDIATDIPPPISCPQHLPTQTRVLHCIRRAPKKYDMVLEMLETEIEVPLWQSGSGRLAHTGACDRLPGLRESPTCSWVPASSFLVGAVSICHGGRRGVLTVENFEMRRLKQDGEGRPSGPMLGAKRHHHVVACLWWWHHIAGIVESGRISLIWESPNKANGINPPGSHRKYAKAAI